MKIFASTAVLSICVGIGSLLGASFAIAQSSSFAHIRGSSCPSGFSEGGGLCVNKDGTREGMHSNGKNCPSGFSGDSKYCSRVIKKEKDTKKSSSSSSSLPEPTADQTWARLAITARVPKANESDMCPTGYFSNRQNLSECVTHYRDAPKSRLATGGKCAAGETLERGKYCTGATSMNAKDIDQAMTNDFNDLYTGLGVKNGRMPELDKSPPEVGAPLLAQLNAEKDAERARQNAGRAEAERKSQAAQAAEQEHGDEQIRVMCAQVRAGGTPIGPNHKCHGVSAPNGPIGAGQATAAPAAPAAPSPTTAQDAVKQEAGKLLRGLLGR
jgi:hypothetical protein